MKTKIQREKEKIKLQRQTLRMTRKANSTACRNLEDHEQESGTSSPPTHRIHSSQLRTEITEARHLHRGIAADR